MSNEGSSKSLDSEVENTPVFYSAGKAAKFLSVAPETIRKLFNEGRLKGYQLPCSKVRRISYESLMKLKIEKSSTQTRPDDVDRKDINEAYNKYKHYDKTYTTREVAEICNFSQGVIIRCFDSRRLLGYCFPDSKYRRIPHKNLVEFMREYDIPIDWLVESLNIPKQNSDNTKLIKHAEEKGISEERLIILYECNSHKTYTTKEVAEICNFSQKTAIKKFDVKKLRGFKIPGSNYRRIPHKNLVEFMLEQNIPIENLEKYLNV